MSTEVLPARSDADYLAALNQCFNGWGGETEFDWYFRRPFAGRMASRFLLGEQGGEPIAGSAVTWRELAGADGAERRVGIMTGSWTMPAARGRGCFGRIIEVSRDMCVENGSAWLLAFVTEDNASRRALERAGSLMIPSSYVWSPETPGTAPAAAGCRVVEADGERLARLMAARVSAARGATAFHYRTAELFRDQVIDRPTPTEIVEVEGGALAVVERHKVFDRLLTCTASADGDDRVALEAALAARAIAAGRRYFSFTSARGHAARLRKSCGLAGIDGFITLLGAAEPAPDRPGAWFVESGDRV